MILPCFYITTAVNLVSSDSPDLKERDNTNNPIWKRGLYVKLAITSYQTVLFLKDYPKDTEAVSLKMQRKIQFLHCMYKEKSYHSFTPRPRKLWRLQLLYIITHRLLNDLINKYINI